MKHVVACWISIAAVLSLASCADVKQVGESKSVDQKIAEPKINEWGAEPGETYQEVPRGKLALAAFASDYQDKLVTFRASFSGVGGSQVAGYAPIDFFDVNLGPYGLLQGKPDSQAFLFGVLQKANYDMVGSMKTYQNVKVSGRAHLLTGRYSQVFPMVIFIHKIEVDGDPK